MKYLAALWIFFNDLHVQPLTTFYHPFLMTRRAEVTALAGTYQQLLVAA